MTSDPDADGFHFIGNVLHAGHVSLETLAESCGTPSYVYNAGMIRQRISALQGAFAAALPPDKRPLLAYACKANTNGAILRLMAAQGLGADVVSGGEMMRALKAGIPADKIVFSGVGKTEEETTAAIQNEIRQINIESAAELDRLIDLHPPYPLRIAFRLNPDVEPGTHAKISTGQGGSKFGMPADEISNLMDRARRHKNLLPAGLSVHIGSQLTSLDPYETAFRRLADLARATGAKTLDFGGGLGIVYGDEKLPDLQDYAGLVRDILAPAAMELIAEPGRFLVGAAGVLLTRITHLKTTPDRPILILDAGMNDLMRPALYDAVHRIVPVHKTTAPQMLADIAGPVCESSDIFARDHSLPAPAPGDLLAIMDAGAYGASMASNYNSRPLPAEILVDGDRHALIRRRQTPDDMIKDEIVPEWMAG